MRPISSMKLKRNHGKLYSSDLQLEEQVPIRGHPLSGSYFRQSPKALALGLSLSLFPVPCQILFVAFGLSFTIHPPTHTHTYTPSGVEELATTEQLTYIHTHTHPSVTPFQLHLWVFPDFLVSGIIIIIIIIINYYCYFPGYSSSVSLSTFSPI